MPTRISAGRIRLEYYRAHFLESIQPHGIVCLECGKLLKLLGFHMQSMHQITLDDYRETWGFNRQTTFCAEDTAAKFRADAIRRRIGSHGSGAILAKARAMRRWEHRVMRPEARLRASEAKKRLYAAGWQPRRLQKVDDRTLRRLAKEHGVNLKRIARKAKLSVDQTRTRLQKLGFMPPHQPRGPLINRQRVLELRRQGLWPLEIARRMRIKPQYVRKTLWQFRGQGIAIPTPATPRPNNKRLVTNEAFLAAFRKGRKVGDIAKRLGVSRLYVIGKTHQLRKKGLIAPA